MLEQMQGLMHLELSGCNDFTEAGLWSSLNARLTSLSVSDCINVADDAIAAISQLLPNLSELSLQAYHVTDTAMAYFTAKQVGLHYSFSIVCGLAQIFSYGEFWVIIPIFEVAIFSVLTFTFTCIHLVRDNDHFYKLYELYCSNAVVLQFLFNLFLDQTQGLFVVPSDLCLIELTCKIFEILLQL